MLIGNIEMSREYVEESKVKSDKEITDPAQLDNPVGDMVECADISEPFILWNLRQRYSWANQPLSATSHPISSSNPPPPPPSTRFEQDLIYTNISHISMSRDTTFVRQQTGGAQRWLSWGDRQRIGRPLADEAQDDGSFLKVNMSGTPVEVEGLRRAAHVAAAYRCGCQWEPSR